MEQAITATDVCKRFGSVDALAGLTLSVPSGTIFGLLGENGAGKTTFIKVLLDIVRANTGEVTVLGLPAGAIEARRQIGYLPENLQLPAALSPVGFLHSAGRLKGLPRHERDDQIPRLLRLVGLEEAFWNKRTSGFSKGMRQRTGLAGALLGRPQLLVLDEPTDGIDPLGRAQLREVIRAAARRGATVFLNSHLLAETEKIADHVAVLSKGRVVLSGSLDVLRADNRFEVQFAVPAGQDPKKIAEKAVNSGFSLPEAVAAEAVLAEERAAFWFAGDPDDELSAALRKALEAGLHIRNLRPLTRDLESLMTEAVRGQRATDSKGDVP